MDQVDNARRPAVADLGVAALAGVAVGVVQAGFFSVCLSYTVPHGPGGRGFASNIDTNGLIIAFLVFVVASLILIAVALAKLRIRLYGVVALLVVSVQFVVATWMAFQLSVNGYLDAAILLPEILAVECVLCRLLLSRPPAEPKGRTFRDWN